MAVSQRRPSVYSVVKEQHKNVCTLAIAGTGVSVCVSVCATEMLCFPFDRSNNLLSSRAGVRFGVPELLIFKLLE